MWFSLYLSLTTWSYYRTQTLPRTWWSSIIRMVRLSKSWSMASWFRVTGKLIQNFLEEMKLVNTICFCTSLSLKPSRADSKSKKQSWETMQSPCRLHIHLINPMILPYKPDWYDDADFQPHVFIYQTNSKELRLFRVWMEDYNVTENVNTRSVTHTREGEGTYGDGSGNAASGGGTQGAKGSGKNASAPKPKPKPKDPKERRPKTEDQLARAVLWYSFSIFIWEINSFFVSKTNIFFINGHGPYWKLLLPKAIVKVNANLLEISQWHFKLQSAGVCLSWIKMYMSENSFISESEMIFKHNTTFVVLILQYWMFLCDLLPHQLVNNLPTNSIPHENRVHLLIACFD